MKAILKTVIVPRTKLDSVTIEFTPEEWSIVRAAVSAYGYGMMGTRDEDVQKLYKSLQQAHVESGAER